MRSWGQSLIRRDIRELAPSLPPCHMRIQWEGRQLQIRKASPETDHAGILIWGFSPLELWGKNFFVVSATQSMAFCYGSLVWHRQLAMYHFITSRFWRVVCIFFSFIIIWWSPKFTNAITFLFSICKLKNRLYVLTEFSAFKTMLTH